MFVFKIEKVRQPSGLGAVELLKNRTLVKEMNEL
ncbi:hypothetical protein ERIC2_10p00200 (plasmid) [Paenibacillus larvae subsp. larvae DSM 25430]|uniref:Uncharacterized protein n=1 Tax=Paenibacillus larvae subsp. larvae DSM 25430 TaxID=697284 RepID=V9WD97_9BACL|nr:hypothetical protein ERIC2_10p00200 [Paenibacillus larvae subsp. larvae DSM 25430]